MGSVQHLKPVGAHRRHLGRGDTEHHRSARAPFAPEPQFVEAVMGTLGLQFDPAITAVAHPATEAHVTGLLTAGLAIAHPLHMAADDQVPAFLGGVEAMVLPLDPPFHGTAASEAATRRRGISGHPAQWRCSQLA